MRPMILWACAAIGAATLPASAQTGEQPQAAQDPCQAQTDNGTTPAPSASDSLTDTLHPCGGVLKPPPTGDAEMTTPAPAEGKTPVIKPGEVPPQPAQPD